MIKTVIHKDFPETKIELKDVKNHLYGQHKRNKVWYLIIKTPNNPIYGVSPLWCTIEPSEINFQYDSKKFTFSEKELIETFNLIQPESFTELCRFMEETTSEA